MQVDAMCQRDLDDSFVVEPGAGILKSEIGDLYRPLSVGNIISLFLQCNVLALLSMGTKDFLPHNGSATERGKVIGPFVSSCELLYRQGILSCYSTALILLQDCV